MHLVYSQVPLGTAMNSVHLQTVDSNKLSDMVQIYNKHGDFKFTLRDSVQQAYQIAADAGPVALGLAFYCSADDSKKDPLVLSYTDDYKGRLNVTYVGRFNTLSLKKRRLN